MCACEGSFVCSYCDDYVPSPGDDGPPDEWLDKKYGELVTEADDERGDGHPRVVTVVVDDTGATDEIERR